MSGVARHFIAFSRCRGVDASFEAEWSWESPSRVHGEILIEPGAESAIAVSPVDSNRVIAGFNTDFPRQRMVYSTDGGATWSFAVDLPSSCCDPTVGWSTDGLVAYTATLKNCSFSGCGVAAYRSTDGGQTWTNEVSLTTSGSDKEYLHVDQAPSSPYKDYVYLTWTAMTCLSPSPCTPPWPVNRLC